MLERKKRLVEAVKQNSSSNNNNSNNSNNNSNSSYSSPTTKNQLTRNWATIGFFDAHPTFETIRPIELFSTSNNISTNSSSISTSSSTSSHQLPNKSPRRFVRLTSLDEETDTPVIEVGDVFEQIRRKNLKNGARLLYKVLEIFPHSKSAAVQSIYGKEKKTWKELLDPTEYQLVLSDKSYLSKRTFHPQKSLRDPLLRDKAKYSGLEGRESLFLLFRQAPDEYLGSSTPNSSLSSPRPITPRLTYVMECRRQQIPPIPLLTRCYDENYPVLNLSNQSIGERFTVALAQSLPNMKFLKEIDLTNNRLDSQSIPVLIHGLAQSYVESIILDKNRIGKGGINALDCLMSGNWHEFKDKKIRKSGLSIITSPVSPRSVSPISASSSPISSTSSHSSYIPFSPVRMSSDVSEGVTQNSNDISSISSNQSIYQSISSSSISSFSPYSHQLSNSFSPQIPLEPLPPHSIVKLSINSNSLGDNTVSKLIQSIQVNCKTLKYLSLNNNSCSTFTVTSLSSLLREGVVPLEYLDLSWNNLGTENAAILLQSLARHFTLKKLILNYNGINSNIIPAVILLGGMKPIGENNPLMMTLKDQALIDVIGSHNGVIQLPLNQTIELISLSNNSVSPQSLEFLEANSLTELQLFMREEISK